MKTTDCLSHSGPFMFPPPVPPFFTAVFVALAAFAVFVGLRLHVLFH